MYLSIHENFHCLGEKCLSKTGELLGVEAFLLHVSSPRRTRRLGAEPGHSQRSGLRDAQSAPEHVPELAGLNAEQELKPCDGFDLGYGTLHGGSNAVRNTTVG
jgi:hypothetical protein